MASSIPEPWLSFLVEVDRALDGPVEIHCLGGFILTVFWNLPRPTGDIDVIHVGPTSASAKLLDIAGEGTELTRRFRLHVHRVGVADYPEGYASRLIDITPESLRRLRVLAFEVHDLALAKLGRNSPRDRSDIEYLVQKGALERRVLETRFKAELRPYLADEARARTTLALWVDEFFGS
jgi:hypothetical protein